jgi:catechol-2,3-dioxygenase
MKKSLLSGIPGVLVPVSNLAKSALWYNQVLGLEEYKRSDVTVEFKVNGGDPILVLVQSNFDSPVRFPKNEYTDGSFFIFKTSDAEALHQELIKNEVMVSEIFIFDGVQKYFFFEDPDGNKLSVEN